MPDSPGRSRLRFSATARALHWGFALTYLGLLVSGLPLMFPALHVSVVPYQALATRDGQLIIAVLGEKFWGGFCRAVEHPEWEHDPRFATNRDRVANRAALMALIEAAFARRTTDEWLRHLQAHGVPATPILTVDRVLSDPQVRHRRMVVELQHDRLGTLPALGTPIKVDGAMETGGERPPGLGEHTEEVLAGVLKVPAGRIALREEGVIR